jgi:hypothetical protein
MPGAKNLVSHLDSALKRYPKARTLGEDRFITGKNLFFDSKNHRARESVEITVLGLLTALGFAEEVGQDLKLFKDEETFLRRRGLIGNRGERPAPPNAG